METKSSPIELDLRTLEAIFKTSKKTIQEYTRELERYDRYRSLHGSVGNIEGAIMDDRAKLIDLYDACKTQDAHLSSVLETLESQIVGERYMMANQNEKGRWVKDVEETRKIQGTQFTKIIRGIVEAKFYGYTAFEILPDRDPYTGRLTTINQVERRNIFADQRRIVKQQGMWSPGWYFDDPQYKTNYVLVNTGTSGLFSAIVPLILAKKFTMANYVNFSHTYGQPIIHGKCESEAVNDRQKLANDIASAAQNKVIVTGLNDEVDIKTFTMSNSEKVFTSLIESVDKDVSNIILGSESMAGAQQSYVGSTRAHQDVYRDRVTVYREYIENVMNEDIVPRLVAMGYLKPGLEFKYSRRLEMSNEDQIKLYDFITDKYEVSPDEIDKAFGVVVGRQINLNDGSNGGGGSEGDGTSRIGERMSDEEYEKRYGHPRNRVNFLSGRR